MDTNLAKLFVVDVEFALGLSSFGFHPFGLDAFLLLGERRTRGQIFWSVTQPAQPNLKYVIRLINFD